MNVADTISIMIKSFPSIYGSYTDALYGIASGFSAKWDENGDVLIYYSEYEPYPFQPVVSKIDDDPSSKLMWTLDNAKNQCIIDNIDLVISAKESFVNQVPGEVLKFLEKGIPENANKEWRDAFLELIDNIIYYRFPKGKFEDMVESYASSYHNRLKECVISANKCKVNLIGTDAEKVAQKTALYVDQIQHIVNNAMAQGIEIVFNVNK